MPEKSEHIARTAILERRVRLAATLVCAGLVVLLITLIHIHPLAFVAFTVIGCPLVLTGIVLFLYSIISQETDTP